MSDTKFIGTPRKVTTHVNQNEDLIFEKSSAGKKAYRLAELDVPAVDAAALLGEAVRGDLGVMPELSEIEIIRHFYAAFDVELCDRPGNVSAGLVHDEVQPAY